MSLSVLEPRVETAEPAAVDWLGVVAREKAALAMAVRLGDWMSQGYSHRALGQAALALGDQRRGRQQLAEGTYILRALGIDPDPAA
ncbi:hypothetical protein OHA70_04230 [Kribbella sp. NBC_00382]|uniref:hypothetical protein n=1 Tax=Kribbella sp. NBC_00382 TaxID=2975967 RepID=UPI002E1EE2AB